MANGAGSSKTLSKIARWNRPAASGDTTLDCRVDGARGLAADGDVVLVAAEFGDVLLHPFERELLIEDAIVAEEMAFGIQRGMRQKAEKAEAIIDGDDDRVALRGQLAPVIIVALAVNIAAAMNPDDDRKLLVRRRIDVRREDVEIKAVFVVVGGTRKRRRAP